MKSVLQRRIVLTEQSRKIIEGLNARIAKHEATIARLEAEVEAGWQPIETAPRDGTPLDLWHIEFGRYPDCHWGKPEHSCGEAGQYCDSDWHTEPEGWVDGVLNVILSDSIEFTHWRRRPAPPRTEGERA